MRRRNIFDIIEGILKILKNKDEMSVQQISKEVKSQWKTTIKALEFMKRINLVKERESKKTHKEERILFILLHKFLFCFPASL